MGDEIEQSRGQQGVSVQTWLFDAHRTAPHTSARLSNDEIKLQSGNLSDHFLKDNTIYFCSLILSRRESVCVRCRDVDGRRHELLLYYKQFTNLPATALNRDMNRLVMDYLVIEGYKDAAQKFAIEAGLNPQVDLNSIQNRMVIRSAVQRGDIEDAISRVNELDPEVSHQSILWRAPSLIPTMIRYFSCTTLNWLLVWSHADSQSPN